MLHEARIYSLANVGGQCVLVLEETEGPRLLPVWIGLYEGGSIGMALAGQKFPRPLTHDLFLDALERLGTTLEKVVVTDLRDSTFFAEIHLKRDEERLVVDARDRLVAALRAVGPEAGGGQVGAGGGKLWRPTGRGTGTGWRRRCIARCSRRHRSWVGSRRRASPPVRRRGRSPRRRSRCPR